MLEPIDLSSNRGPATAPIKSAAQLRELAYAQIKQRIISCEFRPGDAINEAQLTAALGLGRTPIHQALHRLEVEGMVTIMPRKGVMVTALSLNDVLDMIEVRVSNEQLCIKLAVERCPACARIIWLDDAAELMPAPTKPWPIGGFARLWHHVTGDRRGRLREEREWHALPRAIREAESIDRLAGVQDFIEALAALSADETDREIYLRRRLWWASNDHLRQHSGDTATTLSPAVAVDVARANAQRLLEMIQHDPDAQVERGELLRQLGRFDEAVAVLKALKPDGYNEVKAVKIERLALAGIAELRALNTAPMVSMDSEGNSIQGTESVTEVMPKRRLGDRAEDYDIPEFLRHKTRHEASEGEGD